MSTGASAQLTQLAEVTAERDRALMDAGFMRETLVDAGLQESFTGGIDADDRGWIRMTTLVENEISPVNRYRLVETCRMAAVANPLLKGGLLKRIGYIWGQGVEISARIPAEDGDTEGPDPTVEKAINQAINDFEKLNEASLMGTQAREDKERALGTDGEVFLALFTDSKAGEVRVRTVPDLQIMQVVANPEDADDPWFYLREYTLATLPTADVEDLTMQPTELEVKRVLYPALGFDPKAAGYGFKPVKINGIEVMWDAPMVHLAVNKLDGWERGIPDVYASLAWARFYQEFLVDWAGLTKSLSKIAFKATGESRGRAAQAAAAIKATTQSPSLAGLPGPSGSAGGTVVTGPGSGLEVMSKSGATIDSNSGKPLAAMVAAGLGLPVTMLLADPGISGARATAQTLDTPTILEMGMRRLVWQSLLERILLYAVTVAAGAPSGSAIGAADPVLDFAWPPIAGMDPVQIVAAIVAADSTGKMPPPTTARLLLSALGVPDPDEILAKYIDADGNWVDPEQPPKPTSGSDTGQAAVDAARHGEDPAGAVDRAVAAAAGGH
jgi:hypothetical protein